MKNVIENSLMPAAAHTRILVHAHDCTWVPKKQLVIVLLGASAVPSEHVTRARAAAATAAAWPLGVHSTATRFDAALPPGRRRRRRRAARPPLGAGMGSFVESPGERAGPARACLRYAR